MIIAFIDRYGMASRCEIENLLMDKLSDVLTSAQNKINNYLSLLRDSEQIINNGTRKQPKWIKK